MKKGIKGLLGLGIGTLLAVPFMVNGADAGPGGIICPEEAFAGEVIECTVKRPHDSLVTYTGISAKYDLSEGVTYDSLSTIHTYSVNTYTDKGFVFGNTTGLPEYESPIATIKFKLADDLEAGSVININLTDVNLTDTEYNDYDAEQALFEDSAAITIVEDILELDSSLTVENNIIYNLPLNTYYVENFLNLIHTNGTASFVGFDAIEAGTLVGTGWKVKVELHKSTVEYILSVRGDVTGDGAVKMSDVMKAANQVLDDTTITGDAYLKAGDITGDGDIKMSDVMKLANYVIEGGNL